MKREETSNNPLLLELDSLRHEIAALKISEADLERSQKELQAHNVYLSALIENSLEIVFTLDDRSTITYVSPSVQPTLGYNPEELLGRNCFDFFLCADLMETIYDAALEKRAEHVVIPNTFRIKHQDGTERFFEGACRNLLDNPAVAGFIINLRDVTEYKQQQDELIRIQKAVESSSDAIAMADPQGKHIYHNQAFTNLFGYVLEDLNNPMGPVAAYADAEVGHEVFNTIMRGGSWKGETTMIARDNCKIMVSLRADAVRDDRGNIIGLIGIHTDITERKRAEETLIRIQKAVESSGEAIGISDPQGVHFFQNRAFTELFGYTVEELNKPLGPVLIYGDPEVGREVFDAIMKGGYWNNEIIMVHKSGRRFPASLRADAIKDDKGNIVGLIGIHTNITEGKKAMEEMEALVEELARSNKELEQFAYVASHDLQEPLRMVASFTQLLAQRYKGKLDADADEFIGYTVDGATRMQRMINDLLAYSRVTTRGKKFERIDCNTILEKALFNLKFAIEETDALITHDDLPAVRADATQLTQVFQNLIGNAIKFHGKERPHIHISAKAKKEEWVFQIKDNGIGIETQYFDRIFDVFKRLHHQGEYISTGIGLAIAKKIVERHGGLIWVESEQEKGSTFYLTIPDKKGPET